MLTEIATALVTRLQTVSGIGTVTADAQVEQLAYPAAQVYLVKDQAVTDKAGRHRDLQWVVQLTSYGDVLAMVDAIRNVLTGWKLPGKGSSTVHCELCELARIETGQPLTYLIRASVRVVVDSYTST
jgi:hypothetical protein